MRVEYAVAVVLAVLWLVPCAWHGDVKVDLPKLTEEWYKCVFGLSELALAAFVVQRLVRRADQRGHRQGAARIAGVLRASLSEVLRLEPMLISHLTGQPSSGWRPELAKELLGDVGVLAGCLQRLAVDSEYEWTRDAAVVAGLLDREFTLSLRKICARISMGEVVFASGETPLFKELVQMQAVLEMLRESLFGGNVPVTALL